MEQKINEMKALINMEIGYCKYAFEHDCKELYKNAKHEIDGMIAMLNIVTGKEHYFDENGLHER